MEFESYDKIFKVALQLYYQEPIRCKSHMASPILKNIQDHNANSAIERGIIATSSFFIDHGFCLAIDSNANFQCAIPANWKNSIGTQSVFGQERSTATYFLRKKTQNFILGFSFSSLDNVVAIHLTHLNTKVFPSNLLRRDLDGLSDGEHASSFASHIWYKLKKAMKHALVKADLDLPPSTISSPLSPR